MMLNKITAACLLSVMYSQSSYAQDISGTIKSLSGQPIANAKISAVGGNKVVTTDKNGQFTITDLANGTVELHITAKNFSHRNERLTLGNTNIANLDLALVPSVMEVIDVNATPLHSSNIESALPVNVLAADELRTKHSSTLGETLKNEVGVHSSYYGPGSSSPIIRGLDGPRVLITQNGLDVGDASRVGPDHAVSSDTANAQQVEVLRGPATLFYGSGAIGGVVNVVDNRVPKTLDKSVDYMAKHNDVADENEVSLGVNSSVDNFAIHLDGYWRQSNDYEIPGYAESARLREEEALQDEDHDDEEEAKGVLANSDGKASGFTIGSSYIFDDGFVGFSYGRTDRTYGIVGHSHEDHDHDEDEEDHDEDEEGGEERVYADLSQDKYQMLTEWNLDNDFFSQLAGKMSYTDYQHQEIENGAIGTVFKNELFEARFDAFHQEYNGWKGAWTVHYKNTDFSAQGEEAFTPPSETESIAMAWIEEKHIDNVLVQLGARIEHISLNITDEMFNDEITGLADEEYTFTPTSASLGLVWDYQSGYNLGMSVGVSQRAPSAAELFSFGPHIGTSSYEIGALYQAEFHDGHDHNHFGLSDSKAEIETSYNLDLTWRKFEGDLGFVISAFYNRINDYYYSQNTGLFYSDEHEDDHDAEMEEESGLPIYNYQQNDVELYGFEAEFVYQINSQLKGTVFTDYISASLVDGGDLPRIPPMRIGGLLNYQANDYDAEISVSRYNKQSDIATLETSTDGYTMVDAHVNYYLDGIGDDFVLFAKVSNLTNEDARVHSSFLKDLAPLPGRGFTVGVRGSF
ncbi:TonB-dependent receptor [Thalassotalea piscium]